MTSKLFQNGGGGYPKGFKYPSGPDGKRYFALLVTPELRAKLNIPIQQLYYGHFNNKKPIEAASKAYTMLCRDFGEEACQEMLLTIVAPETVTKKGPKVNRYWVKRRPYSNARHTSFASSGRAATYRWTYDIVPEKFKTREDAATLKNRRSLVARERYLKLAKKPTRYSVSK